MVAEGLAKLNATKQSKKTERVAIRIIFKVRTVSWSTVIRMQDVRFIAN